jgi:cytochrome c oxidase assembly protein subunit 15
VTRILRGGAALTGALAVASIVSVQAALGIVTLLYQAPFGLALLHQATAIVVLAVAVVHAQNLTAVAAPRRQHESDREVQGQEQAT